MTEQKVRRVSTFWQLPDAEARELVRQAQNQAAAERARERDQEPPAAKPVARRAPPEPVMPYHDSLVAGTRIADALEETAGAVRYRIRRVVRYFGVEQADAWLAQAQAIYTGAGMLTANGSRRRTLGGIWFVLVKRSSDRARVKVCFPRTEPRRSS